MANHDWTRVDAGLFHSFHQRWITYLSDALNSGRLPPDYFALPEQRIHGAPPDFLPMMIVSGSEEPTKGASTLAVKTTPPRASRIQRDDADIYARKADRITVRHRHGDVVAVIEIVSPGNKASKAEFRSFVQKSAELLREGIHLLLIDLFPPGPRDPQGIHQAIWSEFTDEPFDLPKDKPLLVAAYDAGPPRVAYVQPVGIGDVLPEMPLFLKPEEYVPAPLESTYQTTWNVFPTALKGLLELPAEKQ